MTPRRDPVPRAREAARWLAGLGFLGLLAAGIAGAATIFWERVDVEAILRAEDAPTVERVRDGGLPPRAPASASTPLRAAVVEVEANRGFFPDDAFYLRQVDRWRGLLDSLEAETRTVASAGAVDDLDAGTAVVVPVAPCLPFDLTLALYRHLRNGGSLVLEGPVGARDGACEWRGWDVLRSLTGARSAHQLEPRTGLHVAVPAGLPFSHGLVPGERIDFGHDLEVALDAPGMGAYWSDWALGRAPAEGSDGAATAGLARVTEGGGRLAWFGFLASDAASPEDRRRVRRMHAAALAWAGRRPVASLAAWPAGRQAALVVGEEVEGAPENAEVLADALRRRGTPGTFFVVSAFVEEAPGLAGILRGAGEVGTHTVDQRTLSGETEGAQLARLRAGRSTAERWCGCEVGGLRPPMELFDRGTLRAWSRTGGRYLAAENLGRSASPELHPAGGDREPVVLLPRVVKDDYNLLMSDGLDWERAVPELVASARRAHGLGGLALVVFHTQLADMAAAGSLDAALDGLEETGGWWAVTAGEAAAWWRARHAAAVEVTAGEREGSLELRLTAPPDVPLVGATVGVLTPGDPAEWSPAPGTEGVRYATTPYELRVVVDSVAAGETATVPLRRRTGQDGS